MKIRTLLEAYNNIATVPKSVFGSFALDPAWLNYIASDVFDVLDHRWKIKAVYSPDKNDDETIVIYLIYWKTGKPDATQYPASYYMIVRGSESDDEDKIKRFEEIFHEMVNTIVESVNTLVRTKPVDFINENLLPHIVKMFGLHVLDLEDAYS